MMNAAQQTAQVIFGVERIRPGAGDTPAERAANGEVLKSLEFPNLILDVGLDAQFSTSLEDMMAECHVGTGSAEPTTGDEGLATEIASTTNTSSTDTGGNQDPLYSYQKNTFVFGEGQAEGNLTEVGLSDGATTETFLNRQLFRDGNGDPVTVTIASDEILRVTAEGRWYSDIQTDEQTTGQFTFKGSTIDYTRTVDSAGVWTGTLGPANDKRGGLSAGDFGLIYDTDEHVAPDSVSVASYTSGDYAATYTLKWDAGTLDGTYSGLFYAGRAYRFDFTPEISVASTEELTLTITLPWGRNP